MASARDTATFFVKGTAEQFHYCLSLYPKALRLKADNKAKKPEELIKLDNWYQNELPKTIKSRGKDAHLKHEELCQAMKWKQTRGKFFPQLSYLVKVNTPRAVMAETKRAFKKLPNLEQAITALSNLKGVGTTMASALLAAAAPESAPFMADECLMAIPEFEGIDYTTKEYLNFVQHIQNTVDRLNKQRKNGEVWSPHMVELAIWTHYVASEHQPELLEGLPELAENGSSHQTNLESPSDDSNLESISSNTAPTELLNNETAITTSMSPISNGKDRVIVLDENSTTTSYTEDSLDKPSTPITECKRPAEEDTCDSIPSNEDSSSNTLPRATDEEEEEEDNNEVNNEEPPTKKAKK